MIVIGEKYTHKEKGGEYIVKHQAICKDRDIAVVIYSDSQGNLYTRSANEFKARFKQVKNIVLFKCEYKDIFSDNMQ